MDTAEEDRELMGTREDKNSDSDSLDETQARPFRRQVRPHDGPRGQGLHNRTWPRVKASMERGRSPEKDSEGPARPRLTSGGYGAKDARGRAKQYDSNFTGIGAREERSDEREDVGPEELRALRRAFDMYDVNGDGFITLLEVR